MADANQFQIVLSFKAVMDGLNGFVNGYKQRMAEVEAFNQRIVNGGAAIQKMLGTLGVVLGATALHKYTQDADEADQAQQQLLRTLQRVGESGAAQAFNEQSAALTKVTNFSQNAITTVQRLLVSYGLSAVQAKGLTENVLDFAQETGQSAEIAAAIVGRALAGQTADIGRWKISLDTGKGKVDALRDALEKFAAGAARGGVANPEARQNTANFSQATEDLGRAINKVIVPIQTQLVPLIEWLAEKAAALSNAVRPLASDLGKLAAGAAFVVGAFGLFKIGSITLLQVINPLRAAFVLLAGESLLSLNNRLAAVSARFGDLTTASVLLKDGVTSLAGAGRLLATSFSIAGAALAGWELGTLISNIQIGKLQIKDFVAIAMVWIGDKLAMVWDGLRAAWAVTKASGEEFWDGLKTVTLAGVIAILEAWNKLPFGQKLKVDLSPLRKEFDATAQHLAGTGARLIGELDTISAAQAARKKANADLIDFIHQGGAAGATSHAGAGAGSGATTSHGPRKDLNAEHFGIDQAEQFRLQTQLLQAQLAGNQAEVDRITDLLEQIKLKQELTNLDDKAAPLVAARIKAEQDARAKARTQTADEISFQQKLAALEIRRSAIENNRFLSDLEKQQQLNALLAQENKLLDDKIAKDEALLKAGVTDQEKTRLLQEIDSLQKQLAQNTGAGAPAQTLQQRDDVALKDLNDPAKHYQSAAAGAKGGASQFFAGLGTAADNVSESITSGLNAALTSTGDLLNNILSGAMSMKDAWHSAVSAIGQSFTRMISDMVAKMIWRATIERALTALGVTTHVTGEATKTAATTAGAGTRMLMTIKEALASVYHGAIEAFEALASIPYVGPFLGIAAMAAAIAAGVALVGKIGHAEGAIIRGPGSATSDSIPAMLSNGEAVTRASSVQRFGEPFFQALNAGVLDLSALPGSIARSAAAPYASAAASPGGRGGAAAPSHTIILARDMHDVEQIRRNNPGAWDANVLDTVKRNRASLFG